ncbi:MAG: hypothetical protein RMJ28_01085 [Nitrososphaerota archaeon]|nr:hypothetical protein [Candidatus Calditenuaceae archaeon]MDW8072826.1 hypothetical protein [Nitrososphaerota archaeon]
MRISRADENEELEEIVRYINEKCSEGAAVLVEGVSDREALSGRGVRGKIFTLHEFLKIVEFDALNMELIALLDLDREGERILRWLEGRTSHSLKLDYSTRMKLRKTQRYRRGLRTVHQIFMGP